MAPLSDATPSSIRYALTVIDSRGRCASKLLLRYLGWRPNLRVTLAVSHGVMHVVSDPAGPYVTTKEGYLRFPAPLRHRCGMEVGDHVLLAVIPGLQGLVVYTAAVLDSMISSRWPLAEGESG